MADGLFSPHDTDGRRAQLLNEFTQGNRTIRDAINTTRRQRNLVAVAGDSRAASLYTGARQKGGNNALNVACALSGQRYRAVGGFGISGKRTDEYLTYDNLAALINTRAGTVIIMGALNDIGQDFPTAASSGLTAAINVQNAIQRVLLPAGFYVIVEAELGQNSITQARLGQVHEYNQRMREFCERTPGVYWHDARAAVLNATASTTSVAFKTSYHYDGTHYSQLGAYYHGKSLKLLLDSITPYYPAILANGAELPGNGRFQLFDNPIFATLTGGSTSTGVTGTFPGSCTVNKTGAGTTVACTPGAQNTVLAIDFAAQGDNARISQTASNANWQVGDIVQAVAKFTATSPGGLAGVQLSMVPTVDAVGTTITDMAATATYAGPDETHTMTLMTDPFIITGTTKTSLAATLQANAFGDGAAFNLAIEYMAIIRRVADYTVS